MVVEGQRSRAWCFGGTQPITRCSAVLSFRLVLTFVVAFFAVFCCDAEFNV